MKRTCCSALFSGLVRYTLCRNAVVQCLLASVLFVLSIQDDWNVYTLSLEEWKNVAFLAGVLSLMSFSTWVAAFVVRHKRRNVYGKVPSSPVDHVPKLNLNHAAESAQDRARKKGVMYNVQTSCVLALIYVVIIVKVSFLNLYAHGSAKPFPQYGPASYTDARKLILLNWFQHAFVASVVNLVTFSLTYCMIDLD